MQFELPRCHLPGLSGPSRRGASEPKPESAGVDSGRPDAPPAGPAGGCRRRVRAGPPPPSEARGPPPPTAGAGRAGEYARVPPPGCGPGATVTGNSVPMQGPCSAHAAQCPCERQLLG